jgi:hypothetical protein
LSRGRTREDQVGHVDTRDQQHDPDGRSEDDEQRLHRGHDEILQWDQHESIGIGR